MKIKTETIQEIEVHTWTGHKALYYTDYKGQHHLWRYSKDTPTEEAVRDFKKLFRFEMMTEIEQIKEAVKIYEGYRLATQKQWLEAERFLLSVHDTYGTIEIDKLKNILADV